MNYPASTYRIQFNSKFTFKDFAPLLDYLKSLGISTIYASPITKSEKDSVHGYDVTDASMVNPEIGTLEELRLLSKELQQREMTWLQDIVPNHMAFSMDNPKLYDVLERGQFSPFYNYFDIFWDHPELKGKVQIPTLGKELKQCIEEKEISLIFDTQSFQVKYMDNVFPLSVTALPILIEDMKGNSLPEAVIQTTEKLWTTAYHTGLEEWTEQKKQLITTLLKEDIRPVLISFIDKINGDADKLRTILDAQAYKLAFWQLADSQMNYRRFFTVNSLICLSMENEAVFNDYNSFFGTLFKEGLVHGFRIDHIDGLYNPQQYVERLRGLVGSNCYLIAEKILEYHEEMPRSWGLEGTSGYEFLSYVNRVLTDMKGAERLKLFYQQFSGEKRDYQDIVFDKKRAFLYSQMRGELQNLMQLLQELQLVDASMDLHALKKALAIFMAAFPVYRIYPTSLPLSDESLVMVSKALETALRHEKELDKEFGFIKSLFEGSGNTPTDKKLSFIMRLMQFTGPLAAKGVEDTTFYVYNPLISHNEVGDAPDQLGISVEEFHQKMKSRQAHAPYSLNATSTHDTKRGEDARMRINTLAQFPDEWAQLVDTWHKQNAPLIKEINNLPAPSPNDEYFIYQSLLGAFPEDLKSTEEFSERTKSFITKALREAKVNTTYTEPNEAYEQACIDFALDLVQGKQDFLKTFIPFLKKVISFANVYTLAQTVIKATAPGIPDFYQGTELWNLSYVDPDNRLPVDFEFRTQMLNILIKKEEEGPTSALDFAKEHSIQGIMKLYTTYQILKLRAAYNEVFLKGAYNPIFVKEGVGKLLTYIRSYHNNHVWVIIPLGFDLNNDSYEVTVPSEITLSLPDGLPAQWTNVFTNEKVSFDKEIPLHEILKEFPLAVLKA